MEMRRKVSVAEREPALMSEPCQLLADREAFVSTPPLLVRVHEAGQPVSDGVEVGADPQTMHVDVVTHVGDDGDVVTFGYGGESSEKACCSNASGKHDDHAGTFLRRDDT